ncbi:MAG: acetyl-CoA carboxylase biotin carboxylase subunit [Desulfobacteraceae bacterium]|nr:acetyl-CoA carboxylase biotin carboxylase subunit [Desulfobacteraceae bacterium]
MIDKILIANRGEIAVRVIRTCKQMGIKTVAVYSEADTWALHAHAADEAVYLGPAQPGESYLHIGKIIEAVKKSGAQAVHPGYGFLSENDVFAQTCHDQGIVFIGPQPHVIRNLGNKLKARSMMIENEVPVIPGLNTIEDLDSLTHEAQIIGYPILVKAAAGGGGKGIRVVEKPEDLPSACESVAREAAFAFGDGTVYLEKFLTKTRHVEFQILADHHGNIIHLLERECSIQRRHQKIIEETPCPALSPQLRDAMGQAAIGAARAAGYTNAGTVEFLLTPENTFFFLEINTRIQVEHPVTEAITGIDLVRKQIEIAAGNRLCLRQEDICGRGHAIECRIYAEDPENNFLPCPGKITCLQEPSGPGIRSDSGIYQGCTVPVEYDPILTKLIAHGQTRTIAINRMLDALENFAVIGVQTPVPFLMDVLKSSPFLEGQTYTDFIESHFAGWKTPDTHEDFAAIAFIVDEMTRSSNLSDAGKKTVRASPWHTLGNWRLRPDCPDDRQG